MASDNLISIRVWGDFACFTRPEMKVERVSYPIMTPSAARGILEAIFWEPEIYYVIDSIRVVKRGGWVSFRRNEVIARISLDKARTWMKDPEKFRPIRAGGGAGDGTQRNTLALEDVEYVVAAEVRPSRLGKSAGQHPKKYMAEIERRARQGKCFHRPALGIREFAADFEWEPDAQAALERRAAEIREDHDWRAIWPEEYLGHMLYDVFDYRKRAEGFRWLVADAGENAERGASRRGRAVCYAGALAEPAAAFFPASVRHARMDCHPERVKILTASAAEG